MSGRPITWLVFLAVALMNGACAEGPRTDSSEAPLPGAPEVWEVQTVELEETDTVFLGRPISLAIDNHDGSFYVADAQNQRVARFDRLGRLMRTYGSPGTGPGEIRLVRGVFLAGGNVVLVDTRAGTLTMFDRETSDYEKSLPFVGYTGNVYASATDTAWIGVRNPVAGSVVTAWDLASDSMRHLGGIPEEFSTYPQIARAQGIPVVKWADTLLVGFGLLSGLVLLDTDGDALDTIPIPVRHRRGSSATVIEGAGVDAAQLANETSALWAMHRLASGDIALVHYDLDVATGTRPRILATTVYLSILSQDLASACVDQRVTVEPDAQPVIQFHGDTLFVLHQKVGETKASTFISRFQLNTKSCRWIEIMGSTPSPLM